MRKILPAVSLFTILSISAFGQNVCTQTLRQARSVYDEGRIHELPALLESCLKSGFTDDEKTEAYRLLILSYIYLDEPEKADQTMLALLNHNHEFQINPQADPAEFISLYGTFRTKPVFRAGLRAGGTYSLVNVINSYGVHNLSGATASYTGNAAIEAAAIIEKDFTDRIIGQAEIVFSSNKFTYENENFPDDDGLPYARVVAIETQSWLGLNILGQYNVFPDKRYQLHAIFGPSVRYLLADDAKIETEFPKGGEQASGADEDLSPFRNSLNFGLSAGVGVKRKLGKQYFLMDVKYHYGFKNITKVHYDNSRLSTYYGFGLNDMTVSSVSVSVGLLFQYFNPKKLTD
ncbi:outer membrane beta-barrel protein [Fulvivirga imtechensis]|uniref:outer membrane beta-barrel protein n=1 Tax=Fulvivirga imtechensis TaxID=881893 RepID=UPI00058EA1ED|nr:outer membrane beta-barrel protein [Fulvivirga imtechensis]